MEHSELSGTCEAPHPGTLSRVANRLDPTRGVTIYRAHAYNLDIWSDIALPEFMEPQGGVDVVIVLESENWGAECTLPKWSFTSANVVCRFPNVGQFQVRAGSEIRITPARGADTELIRLYVEGMMMAVVLHQRGFHVLHASVVEMQNRAVAFVGHIGAGKSTIALALQGRGHRLVADDNAAIEGFSSMPSVIPAFPRVKVYPAVARTLGIVEAGLTSLHATQVKKTRLIEGEFSRQPVPLDRIYVLSRDTAPGIHLLTPGEAFIEVVKNSVPTRWGLPGGREQMTIVAALLRRIPVYRVRTFDGLEEIQPVAAQIEAHAMLRNDRAR